MNILVLEDRGSVAQYMIVKLTEMGHTILDAYSIPDAQSILDSEKIDYFIVDLNMSPEGLTEEETSNTKDGLLSGWVWLCNYAYKKYPSYKNRTIILSEYSTSLEEYVPLEERRGVQIVPKRSSTSPAEYLINIIKAVRY
jgi:hypothetical protein